MARSASALLRCWSSYEDKGCHREGETGKGDGGKSTAARKCQPFFPLTTVGFRRVCAEEHGGMDQWIFDKSLFDKGLHEPFARFEQNRQFQSAALRG
jgi:hypothetical protein